MITDIKVKAPFPLINETDETLSVNQGFTSQFIEFHAKNPNVYEQFKDFAFQAIAVGRRALSSKLIIERIRWETTISTTDDQFKVSNNHTADYARLFTRDFPEHKGFFTLHPRKIA